MSGYESDSVLKHLEGICIQSALTTSNIYDPGSVNSSDSCPATVLIYICSIIFELISSDNLLSQTFFLAFSKFEEVRADYFIIHFIQQLVFCYTVATLPQWMVGWVEAPLYVPAHQKRSATPLVNQWLSARLYLMSLSAILLKLTDYWE